MGIKYPSLKVKDCCWACCGSGFKLMSADPIKFQPCFMCNGHRGKCEPHIDNSNS